MRYELYIDVFFLMNFMMDYILLMILRKMLACSASHVRVALGAAAGAALTCAVVAVPVPYVFVKLLLFHGVVNVIMLKAGLRVEWGRSFMRAFLFLYIGGFLVGGIMSFFSQYVRIGSLFFALALLGYFLASGIWSLMEAMLRHKQTHCETLLMREDKSLRVKALIDTGNRLRDERTGKAVSIIAPEAARALGYSEDLKENETLRYIPYNSIGKTGGVLPLFEIDRMCFVRRAGKAAVERPLLAVCGEELGAADYSLILNPDIMNWRE